MSDKNYQVVLVLNDRMLRGQSCSGDMGWAGVLTVPASPPSPCMTRITVKE